MGEKINSLEISARLDRLPATRYIWKLVLLLSLGGCFEVYDLFFTAYTGPGLVRSGLFSSSSASFFGFNGLASFVAATFAGLFVGTMLFGFAADWFGAAWSSPAHCFGIPPPPSSWPSNTQPLPSSPGA